MTSDEYSILIESISSCAIEGNKFAIALLKLRKENPKLFLEKLEELNLQTQPKTKTTENGGD